MLPLIIAAGSRVQSAVSVVDLGGGVDSSLAQRMSSAWSDISHHVSDARSGFAEAIDKISGNPAALVSAQLDLNSSTLEMTLLSAYVRKGCTAVETLLKA
jgi:hypothetical protein